jgi:hypothetical protein
MSVLIQAMTVLIPVAALKRSFPGGLEGFRAAAPNSTFRSDGVLVAVDFMLPRDAEVFVQILRREGLEHLRAGECVDIALADVQRGVINPCRWLEVRTDDYGNTVAVKVGAPHRPLAVPRNWRPGNTLTFVPTPPEELPVDEETGLRYMIDGNGRKLYLGQRFEDDDPQSRLALAAPELLRFAINNVWKTLLERGWVGLAMPNASDPPFHVAMRFENQLGLVYVKAKWGSTPLTPFDSTYEANLIAAARNMRGIPIVAECGVFAATQMSPQSVEDHPDGRTVWLGPGSLKIDNPLIETLSFVRAGTHRVIREDEFDLTERIEISDWELLDFAVQVARTKLEEQGYSIESWTTEANAAPHIRARKDDLVHRVVVGPGRYPVAEPIYDQTRLMAAAETTLLQGGMLWKMPVLVANAEDQFLGSHVRPLYRGEAALIKCTGLEAVDPTTTFSSRSVRLFVSSTFKDFQKEREILAKEVVPELRKRSAGRGVAVSLVDLRWGVSRADVAASQAVAACLREIENSHPFFIAFLGQRRGTVPTALFLNHLKEGDGWLVEYVGRSITELEIAYSMLKPNVKNPSALVFARTNRSILGKGREPKFAHDFKRLAGALRHKGYPLHPLSSDFREMATSKLWQLIQQHFPDDPWESHILSSLRRHRQFACHAAGVLSIKEAPKQTEQFLPSSWEASAMAGLLSLTHRRTGASVLEHFCALESTKDPVRAFNERLLNFKNHITNEIGGSAHKIGSLDFTRHTSAAIGTWAARTKHPAVIVLADTPLLGEREGEVLDALRESLPDCCYVVRVGDSGFGTPTYAPDFLRHYLSLSGKTLDEDDQQVILGHPLAHDLSFQHFVADHLIDTASHASLHEDLSEISSAHTFSSLAEIVHGRIRRMCLPGDNWRRVLAHALSVTATSEEDLIRTLSLKPARYFRIQAALAPLFERWGSRLRLHQGASWAKLHSVLMNS